MIAWGIVVAAGAGVRFGGDKHRARLGGRELWQWGRESLLAGGAAGVTVVGPVPGGVPGGVRRRDSVAAGLAAVPAHADAVLVHDAARPLATAQLVARVLDRLAAGDAPGVVPVIPLRDTIKETDDATVVRTLDRDRLVAVQTPQGFRASVLREAHAEDEEDATDDALLLERRNHRVVTVNGEPWNLKVTFPEDLRVLEALLS